MNCFQVLRSNSTRAAIAGSGVLRCALFAALGRVVQADPMKPKLKPPGIKRLKLNHDVLPSTFAFKFNLRRYIWAGNSLALNLDFPYTGVYRYQFASNCPDFGCATALYRELHFDQLEITVGRCRLSLSKPELKAKRLWFQLLKLEYHTLLISMPAFSFNVRRYMTVVPGLPHRLQFAQPPPTKFENDFIINPAIRFLAGAYTRPPHSPT